MDSVIEEFKLIVYPCSVWVAVNCSDDFLSQRFNESFPPLNNLAGDVLNLKGGVMIRFRNEDCMVGRIINHESGHAAFNVLENMGCTVDFNNQEYFCFLSDCIYDFCDQVITKIKNNNNHE